MKSTFKKNILSLSIGAGLVLMFSQSAIARPPHGGGHRGGYGQPDAASILNRMDFDGNGDVTVDDFVNRSQERAEKYFTRLDKDGDELISIDEFTNRPSRHMSNESVYKDDLRECVTESTGISLNERPEPAELFDDIDSDANGSLTIDEFTAYKAVHATERFNEMDADEDDVISEAEITAHIEERKALKEARRNCIEELSVMDGV